MNEPLTKMQRDIILALDKDADGFAAFTGRQSRVLGFGTWQHQQGGIIIRAYQTPQFFLKGRKILEQFERNIPGYWYRLTPLGKKLAKKLREQS